MIEAIQPTLDKAKREAAKEMLRTWMTSDPVYDEATWRVVRENMKKYPLSQRDRLDAANEHRS